MAKKKNNVEKEVVEEPVDTGHVLTEEELNDVFAEEESVTEEQSQQMPDKSQEYLEMAQRLQAEFDNYRRRNLDIAKNSRQEGIAHAVMELLPVIDTINSAKRQVTDENFLKSLELIYKQTLDCFAKLGVKKIEAVGYPFDPNLHNAIMAEEVEDMESDMVIDEFQEGFMLGDKVIRHSVVKVSK